MKKTCVWATLAAVAAAASPTGATVVFFDDFDDPDGTLIDGKAADIADGPWLVTEDLFADLDVVGGVTDTAGTARKAFGFFTAPLGPGQTLTLTVDTANTGGTFFSGGWAGVSLFVDGDERIFLGDTAIDAVWGVQNVFDIALTTNADPDNTATFVYDYDSGDYSLTLGTGESLSGTFAAEIAANNLRFANGNGGDIALDAVMVEITDTVVLDPADLDLDGDVDDADFALFFAAFSGPGVPTGNAAADLDGDTDTDDADFGLAFAAFTGPGGAAASVPEPASLALLGLGGLLAARRRRQA